MDRGCRFIFLDDEKIEEKISDIKTPQNTKNNTKWAMNIWNMWALERNKQQTNQGFPAIPQAEDITKTITEKQLEFFLKRFVFEVRCKNGQPYTPESLKLLCCGIQRYLRESGWPHLTIMDTNKREFKEFHDALDSKCKELYAAGIGTTRRQAQYITEEHEIMLWDKGIFNMNTSQGLSNCVFFYTCKAFGVCSGDEHRNLKLSQFTFGSDSCGKFVEYNGRLSKTAKGGGMKSKPDHVKSIKHYQSVKNPRCYYDILEKYIALIPKLNDHFYFRPGYDLLFCSQVVGKHALDGYVSKMMKSAKIDGYYTNHSIKAALATDLFHKGYDEQLIMERTGHKSVAIRQYKKPANLQMSDLSSALDPPSLKRKASPLKPEQDTTTSLKRKESPSKPLQEKSTALKKKESPAKPAQDTSTALKRMECPSKPLQDTSTPLMRMEYTSNGPQDMITTLKRKECPSDLKVMTLSYKHQKNDNVDNLRENISVYNEDTKIDLVNTDNVKYGNFDLNLGDFLPNNCVIKPKDVNITRKMDGKSGQILIKINYLMKD